jgi:hypothetical protein
MVSYLPLPRWGALSGKSARTCRRWRLSLCVLILACSPQRRTGPLRPAFSPALERVLPTNVCSASSSMAKP